ncbi:MAG: SusC/RagA family TonB-linked outer membrane protein [Chitinophagaceae bacterium]|nr:SusC/RagA family TonB-linked outer membrane protein [Chitinophagaceae bacterium]
MRKLLRLAPLVLLLCTTLLYGQDKTITGVVIADDDNTPLRDVTVAVKNSQVATKTNQAGFYSINAKPGQTLVFTFVDYTRQEVVVGAANTINLRMILANRQLGEVVVTAYGIKKSKRELGYSAQEVKGEDIEQTQRDNWINALAGRVAGANITPTSGVPGASTSIVLRGAVSLGGNNQPLFVIDGVPFDNQTLNQENLIAASNASGVGMGNRNSDYGNRAMDINPADIESVTILKGPEATTLYGSDGASGAIVIVTKKGKAGKPSVSYDNAFRWEKVYRFPEIQTTYGRGANGVSDPNATVNPFAAGAIFGYFGPKYAEGTKIYDNIDAFFKTGFTQKHNVNVEGGTDVSTYRVSANYMNQDGIVPNTGFERITVRLGGTAKLRPNLSLNSSIAYVSSTTNKASKGAGSYLMNLLNFPSDIDVRDYQNADGSRKLFRNTSTSASAEFDNPFWDVNKNQSQDRVDRTTLNLTLSYDPYKWLNLGIITGLDMYSQNGDYLTHPSSRFGFATNGFYSLYEQDTKNWNNVLKGTVKKKFGDFSNTLIVGFANDDNRTRVEAQRGERFYEVNFSGINNTDPSSQSAKTSVFNVRKTRFFGNYSIGYNNLVYLSLAGTREGDSRLVSRQNPEKVPFFNYGAASLSFVFGDLKMFDNVDWFSYGKARLSYGTTAKGPNLPYIIDYTFVSQLSTGGGFAFGTTGNNFGLRPEFTKNFEFGGELKFFDNRLSIDVTRYMLRSRDQIIPARASYGTGTVIVYINGGLIENKGIEAIVTGNVIKQKNVTWDITANFDMNRGTILKMPQDLPTFYDSDTWVFGNLRSQAYEGSNSGNLSGAVYGRNTAGQVLISPTSGLPSSSLADFFVVGDRQPDFRIGVINSFSYKDFSLSFNLDFRKGGDVFNGNEYYLYLTGLSKRTLDREQPVIIEGVIADGLQNTKTPTRNTITVYPFYRSDYYGAGVVTESDFIESVNWMRMRDLTLTYRIPSKLATKQRVFKNASVFVTGTDLFMITNYTGADPSVNANTASNRGYGGAGIDFGSIATPRGINVGCRFQF